MKITILGSGTSIPDADRASPGYCIECGRATVLIDPGSGSLHRLERQGVPFANVSHVLISHFHPDHTGDLVPLLFARRNRDFFPPGRPLHIIGPRGVRRLLENLGGVYGSWIDLGEDLRVVELTEPQLDFRDFQLTWIPLQHAPESVGFRLQGPETKTVAYSGDTALCEGLEALLQEAELAVVESSAPYPLDGHLTPEAAGSVAARCGVKSLVLTHFYPVFDDTDIVACVRSAGYRGDLHVGIDGLKIEL